jgi:hypothetical protein
MKHNRIMYIKTIHVQVLRDQVFKAARISRKSARERVKVVMFTDRPPLPPRR